MLSIFFNPQLLDCFSIPTVLILSWVVLRARYRLTHIGGMALGLMSVVVLVWADIEDGKGGVSSGGKYLDSEQKKRAGKFKIICTSIPRNNFEFSCYIFHCLLR